MFASFTPGCQSGSHRHQGHRERAAGFDICFDCHNLAPRLPPRQNPRHAHLPKQHDEYLALYREQLTAMERYSLKEENGKNRLLRRTPDYAPGSQAARVLAPISDTTFDALYLKLR